MKGEIREWEISAEDALPYTPRSSVECIVVSIGNAITGITAAEMIRAGDPSCAITIVADDPFPAFPVLH